MNPIGQQYLQSLIKFRKKLPSFKESLRQADSFAGLRVPIGEIKVLNPFDLLYQAAYNDDLESAVKILRFIVFSNDAIRRIRDGQRHDNSKRQKAETAIRKLRIFTNSIHVNQLYYRSLMYRQVDLLSLMYSTAKEKPIEKRNKYDNIHTGIIADLYEGEELPLFKSKGILEQLALNFAGCNQEYLLQVLKKVIHQNPPSKRVRSRQISLLLESYTVGDDLELFWQNVDFLFTNYNAHFDIKHEDLDFLQNRMVEEFKSKQKLSENNWSSINSMTIEMMDKYYRILQSSEAKNLYLCFMVKFHIELKMIGQLNISALSSSLLTIFNSKMDKVSQHVAACMKKGDTSFIDLVLKACLSMDFNTASSLELFWFLKTLNQKNEKLYPFTKTHFRHLIEGAINLSDRKITHEKKEVGRLLLFYLINYFQYHEKLDYAISRKVYQYINKSEDLQLLASLNQLLTHKKDYNTLLRMFHLDDDEFDSSNVRYKKISTRQDFFNFEISSRKRLAVILNQLLADLRIG